jgi:flagellar motor switch protein FliN/FliY
MAEETRAEPATGFDFVMDVPVEVRVEIGRKRLRIAEVLRLGAGSVVELDKASGESLDVYVNDRRIARGEAVVVGDRYGIRLTEVILADDRGRGLP